MPKIPMPKIPGAVKTPESTVHMSGAPGMNFRMSEGQALIDLGKNISDAGSSISGAAQDFVSAKAKFLQQQQYTEDRLNATQARNLFRSINAELENRMTENPADFKQFGQWAVDADKRYVDESRQYTARMSPEYRKQFEAEMSGMRTESVQRRTKIGIHAEVTADYNLFQGLWRDAALRGDMKECNRMLEEQRGKLISEQEYQLKKSEYNRLATFGEVKRAVEADQLGIIELLKETGEDGQYKNFSGLTADARERFIRIAEGRDAQRRSDENADLLYRLNNGEQITEEQINTAFAFKTSAADLKQKRSQLEILHKVQGYRIKQADEQRKKMINADYYNILTFNFSSDPAVRQKQYAQQKNAIMVRYANDGETVKKLFGQLDAVRDAFEKPEASYKNTFIYKYSMERLDQKKHAFFSNFTIFGVLGNPDIVKSNWQMAKVAVDEYLQANPGAATGDVDKFIENVRSRVNKTAVKDLVDFWNNRRYSQSPPPTVTDNEIERDVNGRIAIFNKDKKFLRWKDQKNGGK